MEAILDAFITFSGWIGRDYITMCLRVSSNVFEDEQKRDILAVLIAISASIPLSALFVAFLWLGRRIFRGMYGVSGRVYRRIRPYLSRCYHPWVCCCCRGGEEGGKGGFSVRVGEKKLPSPLLEPDTERVVEKEKDGGLRRRGVVGMRDHSPLRDGFVILCRLQGTRGKWEKVHLPKAPTTLSALKAAIQTTLSCKSISTLILIPDDELTSDTDVEELEGTGQELIEVEEDEGGGVGEEK